MHQLIIIIFAVTLVSLVSLIGILFISFKKKKLESIIISLVALASGALLGGAFLHLIPEAYEACQCEMIFIMVLAGIMLFFLLEKILYWRHCHKDHCDIHAFTYMSLVGDAVHNFIDGTILASAFITSIPLGVTTTLAIITHEIPQEIGDFGVLIHGGFTKKKALLYNFLSALVALLGAVCGYYLASTIIKFTPFLLAFAAGGFIYIASSDLIPELHKTKNVRSSLKQLFFLTLGISLMWLLKSVLA
ncbi:MAG: ZIP family metal transporter [Candidatus Woesearchaeota archaeon]